MPTLSVNTVVTNTYGIHARPSAKIVQLIDKFDKNIKVFIENKKVKANARYIMDLMTLEAIKDTPITITVEGPNLQELQDLLLSIQDLLLNGFNDE